MKLIFDIRGTNGSGKTTVVRKLMGKYDFTPVIDKSGKIEAYVTKDIAIIGSYKNTCGGCDGIKTQDEICSRIKKYSKKRHVIFEGVIVSTIFQRYCNLAKTLKSNYIVVHLNTSLDTCINRIIKRRKKAGRVDLEGFNKTLVADKYSSIDRACNKFKNEGVQVIKCGGTTAPLEIVRRINDYEKIAP